MQLPRDMAQMDAQELRDLATSLFAQVTQQGHELKHKQLKIDQLTHEMAVLKRWQFGRRSEKLDPAQRSLLEETIDADLEAIEHEMAWACNECQKCRFRMGICPRCGIGGLVGHLSGANIHWNSDSGQACCSAKAE